MLVISAALLLRSSRGMSKCLCQVTANGLVLEDAPHGEADAGSHRREQVRANGPVNASPPPGSASVRGWLCGICRDTARLVECRTRRPVRSLLRRTTLSRCHLAACTVRPA